MTTPKEPRYPIYLPPPLLSSSLPLPKGRLSQSLSNKRIQPRPILPSNPLRSPGMSSRSSRCPSERTPLLAPSLPATPPQPQRQPLVVDVKPRRRRTALAVSKPTNEDTKKPFYRPRPLWLVPFAIIGALVRGMTLAPRVEVYTQLACYSLHPPSEPPTNFNIMEWDASSAISLYSSLDPLGPHLVPASPDPRTLPSHRCLTDPAVQASAARLQTLMTTIMGLLSALTTTFWGRFSQSHGRTKVLAIATFGLFFTDLVFILTSTPSLPWPLSFISYNSAWDKHKHHLLLIGPVVEGLLGGWTTLQSATSAYISDCTGVGSRAGVFSRFTGVFYVGFSVGPMIAGWIVQHPEWFSYSSSAPSPSPHLITTTEQQVQSVAAVFWVAILCSFINFLLVLFVFPESLDKEKMRQAAAADIKGKGRAVDDEQVMSPVIFTGVEDVEGVGSGDGFVDVEELRSPISPRPSASRFQTPSTHVDQASPSSTPSLLATPPSSSPDNDITLLSTLLRPLSVFLPVYVDLPTRNGLTVKRRRDWSLTLLALGLAGWMLSTGVYQIKYLYAEHVYGWGAGELSWYISWMGAVRAVVLLGGVPWLIERWKPKIGVGKSKSEVHADTEDGNGDDDEEECVNSNSKPAPTRLELGKSIRFDLRLARASLFVDLVSNALIAATPSPSLQTSVKYYLSSRYSSTSTGLPPTMSHAQSQAMFVLASSLSAFGGGLVPAVHSLALCIVQARGLEADFGISGYGLRDVDVKGIEDEERSSYGAVDSERDTHSVRASSVSSSVFAGRGLRHGPRSLLRQSQSSAAAPAPSSTSNSTPAVDSGTLFGAFAVLQSLCQMILGPTLFGLTYSSTVSSYPKTVFILSASLLLVSLVLLLIVRNPVGEVRVERREKRFRRRMAEEEERREALECAKLRVRAAKAKAAKIASGKGSATKAVVIDVNALRKARERRWEEDIERRGRSAVSKDLRGGAVPFGSWESSEGGQQGQSRSQRAMVTRSF